MTFVSRMREMGPRRLDVFVGLFCLVEFQLEGAFFVDDIAADERVLLHVTLVLLALALGLRSRAPVPAALIGLAAFAIVTGLGDPVENGMNLPFFSLFVLTFSMAALSDTRAFQFGAVGCIALITIAIAIDPSNTGVGDAVFGLALMVAAPLVAGRALRSRAELARTLREKTARLEAERAAVAGRATAEERERIAGELHDVVSHALSAMVVQASAARRLVHGDADRARDALSAVEGSGREALTEMRRLLGVLRREDEEIALAPQPSLGHLSTLVRRAAAAGLAVDLEVEGERRPLSPGADLIGYRVVQEALGNALESRSAGRAAVTLRYEPASVVIEVHDDGSGARPLSAIRERVALYGGELLAGNPRSGGHTVRAVLPVEAA